MLCGNRHFHFLLLFLFFSFRGKLFPRECFTGLSVPTICLFFFLAALIIYSHIVLLQTCSTTCVSFPFILPLIVSLSHKHMHSDTDSLMHAGKLHTIDINTCYDSHTTISSSVHSYLAYSTDEPNPGDKHLLLTPTYFTHIHIGSFTVELHI